MYHETELSLVQMLKISSNFCSYSVFGTQFHLESHKKFTSGANRIVTVKSFRDNRLLAENFIQCLSNRLL